MKDNQLVEKSMSFAVEIIKLVNKLKTGRESVVSNQIGRSGTSIGANINEAQYAQSKADFISKFHIALKEANETGYWLDLLYKTEYIDAIEYKKLNDLCTTLKVLLISSLKTAKTNK
jgi:four helix bundle protein